MRRLALLLPLLLALACDRPPYPGAVRMQTPPAVYAAWWAMAELCTGREGDFSAWTFWVAPGDFLVLDADSTIAAYTSAEESLIVLAGSDTLERTTVEHEMIHALGVRRHTYQVFVTQCAVETDATIRLQSGVTEADIPPGH